MVNRKTRAKRIRRASPPSSDSDYSDAEKGEESEEEFLPLDESSEDDEEIIAAREKVMNFGRGWKFVAMLQESDKEDDGDNANVTDVDVGGIDVDDGVGGSVGDAGVDGSEDAEENNESDGHLSEYLESSDPGSYGENSDEDPEFREDVVIKKSRYPLFKGNKGIPSFELDMLFQSNDEFKEAVTTYAIMSRKDIRFMKNEPKRCRAKCKGAADCKWIIFASYDKVIDSFQVKTYVSEHSCEPKRVLKSLTNKFLVSKFYDLVAALPEIKIRYLKPFMERTLQLEINLTQCKRVRKRILANLAGNCIKEYAKLRDYAEELLVSNPGSTVSLLTNRQNENDPPSFKAFYCCFKSCKVGVLNGCRPVLGVDGCFLKGLVKGELLTAIARDGNNQMFPVAWAVVLVENNETWTWFLNLLRHDLGTAEGELWTIISDRQKGLVGAVAETWSKADHRFCCRHLYANWGKTHSGRHLKNLFWALAKSTNKYDFDKNYKNLERVHPEAAKDLMLCDPKHWCKAFFSAWPRCDSNDNNLCEAFNGTIVEARSKSIISILEDIRRAMMRRFRDKTVGVNSWKHDYGPLIHKKFLHNVNESHVWVSEWNGGGSYEVRHGSNQFVVRLREGECTCGAWQLSGIPCPHAIHALHDNGDKPEDYINLWYKTPIYLRAYQVPLEPIRGENMWPKSELDVVVPPKLRKMPGRPKKKRRREINENVLKHKLSRVGRLVTCNVCKSKGHNARNKECPGASSQRSTLTVYRTPNQQTSPSIASASIATASMEGTTTGSCQTTQGQSSNSMAATMSKYPRTSMARVVDRGSQKSMTKNNSSHNEAGVSGFLLGLSIPGILQVRYMKVSFDPIT
ncbi:uncharacterized protein LOC120002562 [Tripterygium wilfordii]|uniref:uncharacterized protein LOC120002562 n=1 Tax=Tripterygium wilfordii TaxID=458696 RepID=UPI0018F804C9|nr:uncharacterized protein LOC120002562 [Tripterygium wilfordii]